MSDTLTVKKNKDFIISPPFDFLMVGGLSIIIFAIFLLPIWSDRAVEKVAIAVFLLNFVLNYPHFTHSYQLLYRNYISKITNKDFSAASRIRHIVGGIITPIVLILALTYCSLQPTRDQLGMMFNIMSFFTGWHYIKQGYGIMITLSVREKVFFNNIEKKILLINAYIVWIFSWLYFNWSNDGGVFHEIPYQTLDISDDLIMVSKILMVIWTIGFILFCVKRSDNHKKLSYNGLVAYICSTYIWVLIAPFYPFLYLIVPAFHSLQYNFLVFKLNYEKEKINIASQSEQGANESSIDATLVWKKMVPFICVGLLGVTTVFYLIPSLLDNSLTYNTEEYGNQFYIYSFMIFVNIHHYFIDFAIWRRENPEMAYLFK